MISSIISRLVILVFGTLYPAYASYKAVRTKNVKEYVKWMMYWIVFALFTCMETFTDVFLSWFPFYYEIKIVLVIWLLSPATKGSSILYRKFVHPMLSSREQEIDEYINKAKEQSYKQVLDLGSKGMSALMQTAIKSGGGLVSQLRKSYSLTDLTDAGDGVQLEIVRRRRPAGRSPGRSATASAIYFSEMDIRADVASSGPVQTVLSAEDISSGYSSAEGLYGGHPPRLVAREALHRTSSLTRSRTTRISRSTVVPKVAKSVGSDDSDNENELFDTNIVFVEGRGKKIPVVSEKRDSSSSENEFYETADAPHGKPDVIASNTSRITACQPRSIDNGDPSTVNVSPVLTGDDNLEGKPLNILNITKDVDTFSSYIQNLIGVKSEERERKNSLPEERERKNSLSRTKSISETDREPLKMDRGGKYHKKAAPLPPQPKTTDVSAIKATLILQPGLVKTIGQNTSENKEIFLQSPKTKRKNVARSPSSISSPSPSKNKVEEAFGKMLNLPRRIGSLNLPKIKGDKRLSWHLFHKDTPPNLLDKKVQSKSDNNIPESVEKKGGSQVSIRSLTDSPLAYRRLKIIRTYVDEDID